MVGLTAQTAIVSIRDGIGDSKIWVTERHRVMQMKPVTTGLLRRFNLFAISRIEHTKIHRNRLSLFPLCSGNEGLWGAASSRSKAPESPCTP